MTTVAQALNCIAQRTPTRARALRAERFYRLSADPSPLNNLSAHDRQSVLQARSLNRRHYMPFCVVCDQEATFDPGLRIWRHNVEEVADHVVEQASHPGSHLDPPTGLSYLVWSGSHVIAWVLNNGTVHIPTLTRAPALVQRHQQQVRQALHA